MTQFVQIKNSTNPETVKFEPFTAKFDRFVTLYFSFLASSGKIFYSNSFIKKRDKELFQ